ncbi:Mur ligase [Fomitiporia mediterranea MF3/22]|uniref:Mur ligase n=1 Tax=Fomitiporia mediterranea (strain MF3/22) TaxID=694068 RepID=UPI0004409912|nr:Mur ligase [Fomitiporia mediterranea MF3/22]EJD04981.1 Mur ligase [Fomitiporia mediterranea MF3/22]
MSVDLSLHRIEALLSKFESYTRPTVHIAGTNGKGSVSALLTSLLRHAGLSVGRFNSPHLLHPSDSISLNGIPVPRQDFEDVMDEVRRKNEEYAINASSFEVLTICALLIFERSKVDITLLEVGMGGRLDATNVIPDMCILASVITAIDLDHQAFLGPTVEDIAKEKAGIIRKGRPIVLSTQNHERITGVIQEIARQKMAPLVLAPVAMDREWDEEIDGPLPPPFSLHPFVPPSPRPVKAVLSLLSCRGESQEERLSDSKSETAAKYRVLLPLHGAHQLGNLGAALCVFHLLRIGAVNGFEGSFSSDRGANAFIFDRLSEMDERTIRAAIRECTWPGRLSYHLYHNPSHAELESSRSAVQQPDRIHQWPLPVVVDGAHNEAASRTLSAYVSSLLSSLSASYSRTGGSRKIKRVRLAIILALSHSPPKTPESVLVPLLVRFIGQQRSQPDELWPSVNLSVRIAFTRFSLPEGMPWVRPVAPTALSEAVQKSFPNADNLELWTPPEADAANDGNPTQELQDALLWAAECSLNERKHRDGLDGSGDDVEENLVLVAGSLYLAADFYRLLRLCKE